MPATRNYADVLLSKVRANPSLTTQIGLSLLETKQLQEAYDVMKPELTRLVARFPILMEDLQAASAIREFMTDCIVAGMEAVKQ